MTLKPGWLPSGALSYNDRSLPWRHWSMDHPRSPARARAKVSLARGRSAAHGVLVATMFPTESRTATKRLTRSTNAATSSGPASRAIDNPAASTADSNSNAAASPRSINRLSVDRPPKNAPVLMSTRAANMVSENRTESVRRNERIRLWQQPPAASGRSLPHERSE